VQCRSRKHVNISGAQNWLCSKGFSFRDEPQRIKLVIALFRIISSPAMQVLVCKFWPNDIKKTSLLYKT